MVNVVAAIEWESPVWILFEQLELGQWPLNTVQTQEIQIQDLVSVHSIFSINDQTEPKI